MPDAFLLIEQRTVFEDGAFTAIRVWLVPTPVPPSRHNFKYSMVYIVDGVRVIGFDNERGKGDHYHLRDWEQPFEFTSIDDVRRNFLALVHEQRSCE